MDWCVICKYNPPDYLSHEPDKPCGDCWVYGEGNEPTKFVEMDNRPTNADKVRAMTDEELADWYWWMLKYVQGYTDSRVALLDWLKQLVEE